MARSRLAVRQTIRRPTSGKLRAILEDVGTPPAAPFVPAPFQEAALAAVRLGDVLVSAPTGSGKTWIAEQAMAELLAQGKTAWYTTPLKALSNQKFHRFGGLYGTDAVGLLTGERRWADLTFPGKRRFDDDPALINRIEAGFRAVTPAMVSAAARRYLREDNRSVLIVEPGRTAAEIEP